MDGDLVPQEGSIPIGVLTKISTDDVRGVDH